MQLSLLDLAASAFLLFLRLCVAGLPQLHLLAFPLDALCRFRLLVCFILHLYDVLTQGHEHLFNHLVAVVKRRRLQEKQLVLRSERAGLFGGDLSHVGQILFVADHDDREFIALGVVLYFVEPAKKLAKRILPVGTWSDFQKYFSL